MSSSESGQGDGSHRLYIQENGDAISIDYGDKEFRRFRSDIFTEDTGLAGLYDELESTRNPETLPVDLEEGIEVTANEIFEYDRAAYDEMADISMWMPALEDVDEGEEL